MNVYGLVNVPLRKVIDVYAAEDEAERALDRVLQDEPAWAADLAVHALELELYTSGIRLRSAESALIDISFHELAATGAAEAPRYLVKEPGPRQSRRRSSKDG